MLIEKKLKYVKNMQCDANQWRITSPRTSAADTPAARVFESSAQVFGADTPARQSLGRPLM